MIEVYTWNFDLHIIVPSPNLALLCRNLDYKPYSINLVDDHMLDNNLYSSVQSAYRERHSNESALIKVQSDILTA